MGNHNFKSFSATESVREQPEVYKILIGADEGEAQQVKKALATDWMERTDFCRLSSYLYMDCVHSCI